MIQIVQQIDKLCSPIDDGKPAGRRRRRRWRRWRRLAGRTRGDSFTNPVETGVFI